MKLWLIAAAVAALSTAAQAQYGGYGTGSNSQSHSVQGYTTRSGTYVQPHEQTNPNNTQRDNYGTSGNYNPYNGHTGRRGAQY
jgi:hypothetical protein